MASGGTPVACAITRPRGAPKEMVGFVEELLTWTGLDLSSEDDVTVVVVVKT